MATLRHAAGVAGFALLMGGLFMLPSTCAAKGDSADINKMLSDVNDQAIQFRADAEKMATFTRSNISWESYAVQLQLIKDHVNAAGKTLAKLNAERDNASPWQQTAINRINPLYNELVANTEAVITTLSNNETRVHLKSFQDYVQANSDLAANLAHVIGDFVDYGNTRAKLERLAAKLEIE